MGGLGFMPDGQRAGSGGVGGLGFTPDSQLEGDWEFADSISVRAEGLSGESVAVLQIGIDPAAPSVADVAWVFQCRREHHAFAVDGRGIRGDKLAVGAGDFEATGRFTVTGGEAVGMIEVHKDICW